MSNGSNITIRHLKSPTGPEIECIVTVLARAFGEDDVFGQMLTGGDISLIPADFRSSVKDGVLGGEIFVAAIGVEPEDIVGAAIWYGPGQDVAATPSEAQRNALDEFIQILPEELRRWHTDYLSCRTEAFTEKTIGSAYRLDSWYLALLGVVPRYQRKGITRSLIKTVEELAREHNTPLVVQATTLLNVVMYRQLGFRAQGETRLTSHFGEVPLVVLTKETRTGTESHRYFSRTRQARYPDLTPESLRLA